MYIDWNGREQEDPEMDAMREDAREAARQDRWVVSGRIASGKLALVRRIVLEAQRRKFNIVEFDSKGANHEL